MSDVKDFTEWTRKEFESLPMREAWDKPVLCSGLVILPMRTKHESGYRHITAVAVVSGVPTCKVTLCSDVIHFDGIGGRVEDARASGWNMDVLPVSGLVHFFGPKEMRIGASLSSLEVWRS